MKERPILFSGPMVRAILDGRKTMTRRVLKVPWKGSSKALPHEPHWVESNGRLFFCDEYGDYHDVERQHLSPYCAPGDRFWVREAWRPVLIAGETVTIAYRADGDEPNDTTAMDVRTNSKQRAQAWRFLERGSWCPSIHMPRWASRLMLEVTEVRVQRLQETSEEDALAEGCWRSGRPEDFEPPPFGSFLTHKEEFQSLWDSIHGKREGYSWEANPWVWAISFKVLSSP